MHVPFCTRRCDYCAFVTFTDRSELRAAYVEACCAQLARDRAAIDRPVSTVFVGGGTPSLLSPGEIAELLIAAGAGEADEVTVEANPDSVTYDFLAAARDAGATRLSLGVESLAPHVLAGLGRERAPGALEAALEAARALGFRATNLDLIFGGAGECAEDWLATLDGCAQLAGELTHVSAYALTIESGTPLARDRARWPDDDVLAERYLAAEDRLSVAGLSWYEISNWARPGAECRHNLSCWGGGDYLGVGAAAHGHLDGARTVNVATPERYLERIAAGASPVARTSTLDRPGRALESLELALRTRAGVPAGSIDDPDGVLGGLIEPVGDRLVLTARGRLLANEVAIRLVVPPSTTTRREISGA